MDRSEYRVKNKCGKFINEYGNVMTAGEGDKTRFTINEAREIVNREAGQKIKMESGGYEMPGEVF